MIATTSVDQRRQLLSVLTDEQLYEMHEEYPGVSDMEGYSCEARLSHAMNLSALKAELHIRCLVP